MLKKRKTLRSAGSKYTEVGSGSTAQSGATVAVVEFESKPEKPENPLMVELILVKVLNMLDNEDLVRCSGVNKLWHLEARKILREKRKCFAKIGIHVPCHSLERFSKMLRKADKPVLPYTGLYLPFESAYHQRGASHCLKTYDEVEGDYFPDDVDYRGLLSTRFKYIHIKWFGNWPLEECPAALLIPELIRANWESLEELQLENISPRNQFFMEENMYKLKILRGTDLEITRMDMDEVCNLVVHARNLEQLLIPVTRRELRKRSNRRESYIRPERYNIVKSLCFSIGITKHADRFEKFASIEPTLRHLIIKYPRIGKYDDEDEDSDGFYVTDSDDDDGEDRNLIWVPRMERCWTILQKICHSSAESLEMLRMPATVAVLQMNWDWEEFPNVTFLALEIPFENQIAEQLLHRVMRRYNFTARFPKLTSITVDDPHDNFYDPKDRSFRNFWETKDDLPVDTAANIKILNYNDHVTDFGIRYLAKLFPHVTELNLGPSGMNERMPYGTIWKELPQLQKLFVFETFWGQGVGMGDSVNYDADFLGVFEAEAESLQKMDLGIVKDLNIVPIKPRITSMKHLREVTVSFLHNRGYDPLREGHFFLSPVGCILTVNRMPHLKFKLLCSDFHYGVLPLKKYVDVEETDPIWE